MWPLLPLLMVGGKLLSGAASGSANARNNENAQIDRQNAILAQLYGTRQGATTNAMNAQSAEQVAHADRDLDRRKYALAAPSVRASQSVRGSILQNAQPVQLSGLPDRVSSRIPQISGGLSPALFSNETRQLGGELTRAALLDQLKGDEFEPLQKTNFQSGILPMPQLQEYQRAGLLEKILGGLGMGATIGGGLLEASKGIRRVPTEDPYGEGTGGV